MCYAPKSLIIMTVSLWTLHPVENIWWRNMGENPAKYSPSNILPYFSCILSDSWKYQNIHLWFLKETIRWTKMINYPWADGVCLILMHFQVFDASLFILWNQMPTCIKFFLRLQVCLVHSYHLKIASFTEHYNFVHIKNLFLLNNL